MSIFHRAELRHTKLFQWATAFLAVILLTGATASYAQTYTLTIRDGNVYVNGKQLPRDEIPASLDVESLDAAFSFSGSTFELDGNYYKIDNYKLLHIDPPVKSVERTTVVFRTASPAESQIIGEARSEYDRSDAGNLYRKNKNDTYVTGDPKVVMQQYVFELTQNARELNKMSASLNQRQAQDLIQQVQFQAEQASQLAQDMPYLEMQNYFSTVRAQDEMLFQRLVSELEMERETQRIATEVRQLPRGEQRNFKVDELHEMLVNILELKQENRRLEINQLEKQLAVLKKRFAERETMKKRLIDRRIKELVGDPR